MSRRYIKINNKFLLIAIVLLMILSISIGFSAFQNKLYISDTQLKIRLHENVRVSNVSIGKTNANAVSNYEDFNVSRLVGNVTLPSTSSYVLYKVDLTNYGNVKSGLLKINNNNTNVKYSICNSSGGNCSSNPKTSICNNSECTLGATKEIFVKIYSSSTGTYDVNLDFDFEPYNSITYVNFLENTTSFPNEILSGDTYSYTFTSKPDSVEISGASNYTYNKTSGLLTMTNVDSDITIYAKYQDNYIVENSDDTTDSIYTASNSKNYVLFNDNLYRIIGIYTIDDGYGNQESRTKIIKDESIGNLAFDSITNDFNNSALKTTLNTTFYNTLSDTSKQMIDYSLWNISTSNSFTGIVGLISSSDYSSSSAWLNNNQFTINSASNNKVVAINNNNLIDENITAVYSTYPVMYLKSDILIVGGTGERTNPFILESAGSALQSNPTIITGKNLTVNGNQQELVEVQNRIGTVYYSVDSEINSSNYSSGSTTIPKMASVGTYSVYYYIPAGETYKSKSGRVTTRINGITYTASYAIGTNVSSIGKTNDSCTTTGTSLTCSVVLPSITPNTGYKVVGWNDGSQIKNVNTSYTLSTDKSFTSVVEEDDFTASFNGNGGTNGSSITKKYGQPLGTLPTSSRDGYNFIGWFTSATGGTQITSSTTMPPNNIEYFAHWADVTNPVITVSPDSSTVAKTKSVKITVSDNEALSNNNSYQYYLSTSSNSLSGGSWTTYTSNNSFTIGTSKTGTYYLFVKRVKDTSNNESTTNGTPTTISSVTYQRFGTYIFDNTKPTCTISAPSSLTVGETGTFTVSCTDSNSGMNSQTLTTSKFSLSNTNATIQSVSSPIAITNGYKYNVVVSGVSTGSVVLSINANAIQDKVGNYNAKTNSSSTTINGKTFTATFVKQGLGVSSISKTSDSCTTTGSNTSCSVETPSITVNSGYTAVGWNTSSTATTGQTGSINISSNSTYYSISYKNAITLVANFNANGASLSSTSQISCELPKAYNNDEQSTSCQINAPTISRSGFMVHGYNTSSNASGSNISYDIATGKLTLTASNNNQTWYAITSKTVNIVFDKNGNTSQKPFGGSTNTNNTVTETCTIWNVDTDCDITSPTITAPTGFTVLGYSNGATDRTISLNHNTQIVVSANKTYYAQSEKPAIDRTITFYKNGNTSFKYNSTTYTSESETFVACTIPAVYNGATQATSCTKSTLVYPIINAPNGFTVLGWSDAATNRTILHTSGQARQNVVFSSNVTFYAQSYIPEDTYYVQFFANGSNTVESQEECTIPAVYNGDAQQTSCTVTPPTITRTGYEIIGWAFENSNATQNDPNYNISTNKLTLTSENSQAACYAITKKDISLVFNKNSNLSQTPSGGSASAANTVTESCTMWNQMTSCSITTPTINTFSGFTALGYSSSSSSREIILNHNTSINVSADAYYYAQSEKVITLTFEKNGATSIGANSLSCSIYNTGSSCDITLPAIFRDDYIVSGWSTNANSQIADIRRLGSGMNITLIRFTPGTTISFSNNATYYAITFKDITWTYYYNAYDETDDETYIDTISTICSIINTETYCAMEDIPEEVTNSFGPYGNDYANIADSMQSMTVASIDNNMQNEIVATSDRTFYAYYSQEVTLYYYNGTDNVEETIYRNSYFAANDEIVNVLSFATNGLTNYTPQTGTGSSVWSGLGIMAGTIIEFESVEDAANSDADILYTIYRFDINYEIGQNVDAISAVEDSCYIFSDLNIASICSVTLPNITPTSGYAVNGWSQYSTYPGSTGVFFQPGTSYSIIMNNTTLYAYASVSNQINVTFYAERSSSLAATTDTISYKVEGLNKTFSTNTSLDTVSYNETQDFYETLETIGGEAFYNKIYEIKASRAGGLSVQTFTFLGWYTASTGGVKVMNEFGYLIPSVSGYTDSSGNWSTSQTNITLYPHYNTTGGGGEVSSTDPILDELNSQLLTKKSISNKNIVSNTDNTIVNDNIMDISSTSYFLGTNILRGEINSIRFSDSLNNHTSSEKNVWDVSSNKDGSILLWIDDYSNNLYDIVIGQNGGVKAGSDISYMFAYLNNLTSINFDNFDTSKVVDISSAFYGCDKLTDIDFSKIINENIINISLIIDGCNNLSNNSLNQLIGISSTLEKILSNKTMKGLGFSIIQAENSTCLSNYDKFIKSGWQIGYDNINGKC